MLFRSLDVVFEPPLMGFGDRLAGVGVSGIDVDLYSNVMQVIGPNLTLWLPFAGTIEFSP